MDEDDEARLRPAQDAPPAAALQPEGAHAVPESGGRGGRVPVEGLVSGAAYLALALLGAVFGLVGAFVQNWSAGPVPVAAIALVVGVFLLVRLSGTGMGGRLGALVPAGTWAAVTFVMSMRRSEGDLVIPGTTAGYLYIVGGMVVAVAAIMLVPAARPPGDWLLGRAARTRG